MGEVTFHALKSKEVQPLEVQPSPTKGDDPFKIFCNDKEQRNAVKALGRKET